jgi:branched-chain amino acid transport system permease protein
MLQSPAIDLQPKASTASMARRWRLGRWFSYAIGIAFLCYLPVVLTSRSAFGVRLSNMQLLNLGMSQINLMLISMLGALSLNYLTGCAGLISIGHAAFYATGALTAAITGTQFGWPFPLVLLCSALAGALAGILAGLPSLRVRGLYFVLSTLAVHYVVVFLYQEYQFKFFDVVGVPYGVAAIGPWLINTPTRWYFFLLLTVALVYWGLRNSLSTREGRVMMAMRDHELAAMAVGADVRIIRLKVFALTSSIAAVAGALLAYYMTNVTSETFNIPFAIQFIAMIIIGGLGNLTGSLFGAALWLLLPSILSGMAPTGGSANGVMRTLLVEHKAQLVQAIFGALVIALLIFAPGGMASLWSRLRGVFARGTS